MRALLVLSSLVVGCSADIGDPAVVDPSIELSDQYRAPAPAALETVELELGVLRDQEFSVLAPNEELEVDIMGRLMPAANIAVCRSEQNGSWKIHCAAHDADSTLVSLDAKMKLKPYLDPAADMYVASFPLPISMELVADPMPATLTCSLQDGPDGVVVERSVSVVLTP